MQRFDRRRRLGKPLPQSMLQMLLVQIVNLVHQVHRAGYVHGSISPVSFAADRVGLLHLLNWERARKEGPHRPEDGQPPLAVPAYQAPEALAGDGGSYRHHDWWVGC